MSRTSRVLASVSLGYASLGLSALFGFCFTPILLRHVGRADFGLWSAAMPILSYVGIVDFGVLTIFQREVAFSLGRAQGDAGAAHDLPALVGTTLRLVLLQMPPLLAAIAIAWLCLPRDWGTLHAPLTIAFACLFLSFPLRTYHALLMGLQDLRYLGIVSLIAWSLGAAVSVVLVLRGWGLNALALSWCVTQLGSVACYVRVRRRFPRTLGGGLRSLSRAEAIGRLRKGFWVIASQIAVALGSGADLLVIAAVLGPAEVTPYTITDKLVTLLNTVPVMIMSSAQPALSELSAGTDQRRLPDICISLTRIVLLMSGAIAGVVIVVDKGFVTWWIGSQEFAGGALVLLLVVDMMVSHWTTATAAALFSFGYERKISIINVCSGVVAVVLTVILARRLGLVGAPIASIAARAIVSLPAFLVAIAQATGGLVRPLLLSVFSWAWRMALFSAAAVMCARAWTPTSPVALAAVGLATALAYAVVMLPLVLGAPLGIYIRPRFAALRQSMARRA